MTLDHERFLEALAWVETGWMEDTTDQAADGDNGQAIGDLQIHRDCWQDAVEFTPDLGAKASYESCRDHDYACAVAESYLRRYANDAWVTGDWYSLARVWNGGPHGASKQATVAYADKVLDRMEGRA